MSIERRTHTDAGIDPSYRLDLIDNFRTTMPEHKVEAQIQRFVRVGFILTGVLLLANYWRIDTRKVTNWTRRDTINRLVISIGAVRQQR